MSEKHSIASKARMAKLSKKELSRRMTAIAVQRQAKLTKKQKKANAMRMVKARIKKAISK